MSDTSDSLGDSRISCKYGEKCYQKNHEHHTKYKHPPLKNNEYAVHVNKKIKVEDKYKKIKEVVVSNDISDSDEDNCTVKKDNIMVTNIINKQVSDSESAEDVDESYNKKTNDTTKEENVNTKEKIHITVSADSIKNIKLTGGKKADNSEEQEQCLDNKENYNAVKLNHKRFIKQKLFVDMPNDFYQFWDYCKTVKPNSPLDALKDIGLRLVGPFDIVAGRFDTVDKSDEEYLLHWRYYRDPPEFQTVLKGDDKTGYHIGYFRDSPDELPTFLASNSSQKDGVLYQMGANIFTAINMYLDDLKKTGDPFKKMHIGKFQSSIKKEAERLKLDLSPKPDTIISREKKIVTRTFNKIGLVVPYNRKTQLGYRELALNNQDLNSLLTKLQKALPEQRPKVLSKLQPVFTYASIAADECDFGTGIELGWNIISHGVDCLNSTVLGFLTTNYRLLNKEAFAKISEAHMANRKKGCDLSII